MNNNYLDKIFSAKELLLNSKNNLKFLNSIKHNNLKPILKTSYMRSYYVCENIRITYDQNLKYTIFKQESL